MGVHIFSVHTHPSQLETFNERCAMVRRKGLEFRPLRRRGLLNRILDRIADTLAFVTESSALMPAKAYAPVRRRAATRGQRPKRHQY